VGDARRHVAGKAQVAFSNRAPFYIPPDNTKGAGQDTGPAAYTFLGINQNNAAFCVSLQGTGQAGINAVRLGAVPALQGEGDGHLALYGNASCGAWRFFFQRLEYISGV